MTEAPSEPDFNALAYGSPWSVQDWRAAWNWLTDQRAWPWVVDVAQNTGTTPLRAAQAITRAMPAVTESIDELP